MTQLSDHFSLEEMTFSQEAVRAGIDNAPPKELLGRLADTCQQAESVRALLNVPMLISSGYRCAELNALVGGSPNSAHRYGYAMDFICPTVGTPLEICRRIQAAGVRLDQCIQEGTWVHLSFAPTYRMQFLTAKFSAKNATYSQGLEEAA